MKKTALFLLTSISLWIAPMMGGQSEQILAAPALRQPFMLQQPDGTKIEVILMGDEYASCLVDAKSGNCLIQDEATLFWRPMTEKEIQTESQKWIDAPRLAHAVGGPQLIGGTPSKNTVKIPVLLVQFSDQKLSENYGTVSYWNTMLNDMNSTRKIVNGWDGMPRYASCARKYFLEQSAGRFDPIFDILQVVTLDNKEEYYGKDGTSKDTRLNSFYKEAIEKAIAQGDLTNAKEYDSDNDGKIDLIYFIFAGCGQNQGAASTTIWPKTTTNYSYTTPDGTKAGICCLTSELRGANPASKLTAGIGVFCHEMSHALGLPDFYSTDASTLSQCYGMDAWSLMDQGEYNGYGQVPANYTLHERMLLGWCDEPDTIPTVGKVQLEPISLNGKGLILRNPANDNEYITIENHQMSASIWDGCFGSAGNTGFLNTSLKALSAGGILISHIDYNASSWNNNTPNNVAKLQRCSPLAADGDLILYDSMNHNDSLSHATWLKHQSADIFMSWDSIKTLNSSNPLAMWHTGDTMAINITQMVKLENGIIEITFGYPVDTIPNDTIGNDTIQNDSISNDSIPNGIEVLQHTLQAPEPRIVILRNGHFMIKGYDLTGKKEEMEN